MMKRLEMATTGSAYYIDSRVVVQREAGSFDFSNRFIPDAGRPNGRVLFKGSQALAESSGTQKSQLSCPQTEKRRQRNQSVI